MRSARLLPALLALSLLAATRAPAQPVMFIAFGDSITEGAFDDSGFDALGYPPRLVRRLANVGLEASVDNRGKGGETTAEALSRITRVLDDGGDGLLLMEGTNDINDGISPETTTFNLAEMARRANARGIETVYATIVPRVPTARFDPTNRQTAERAALLREQAWSDGRRLVDPFQVFWTTPDVFDVFYSGEDRNVGHPNGEGYDLLADTFTQVLNDTDRVPPVPGAVRPADGASGVSPQAVLEVELFDFGAGIDLEQTTLTVNGAAVETTLEGDAARAVLTGRLTDQPEGSVRLGLDTRDLAAPDPNVSSAVVATFFVGEDPGGGGGGGPIGDVDGDGRVDGADLVAFALRFGAEEGDGRYEATYDFDGNGVIDGDDLALLALDFGQS